MRTCTCQLATGRTLKVVIISFFANRVAEMTTVRSILQERELLEILDEFEFRPRKR